jgi:hypothetical protein
MWIEVKKTNSDTAFLCLTKDVALGECNGNFYLMNGSLDIDITQEEYTRIKKLLLNINS